MEITEFLKYGFTHKALLAGCFIALASAMLGVFLILRKLSLIGDGLAHTGFFAIAVSLLLESNSFYISIPIVAAASILILHLSQKSRMSADSAIGLVSAVSIAFAMIIISLTKGLGAGILGFLFGSILTVTNAEVIAAFVIFLLVSVFIFLFYKELICIAFSRECAKLSAINSNLIDKVFIVLTAVTVIIAVKLMGIMLVSAMLIIPAVTALELRKGFLTTIAFACLFSVLSVVFGIILSFVFNLPPSAVIVILNFVFFVLIYIGCLRE